MNPHGIIPSLARVVRGLSALFWGLPLMLLADARSSMDESFNTYGSLPAVAASALVAYGLHQLRHFQSQERIWVAALDRARILSLLLVALSPFTTWSSRHPEVPFFAQNMLLLVVSGLLFLITVNHMLLRLSAMLPDETLRSETRFFTGVNHALAISQLLLVGAELMVEHWTDAPLPLARIRDGLEASKTWLILVLTLLPVALTMTLVWKTKEVIVASVFRPNP